MQSKEKIIDKDQEFSFEVMEKSNRRTCYLCGTSKFHRRSGGVRDNPTLKILECSSCHLVFLSSQTHINKGFYENSCMHEDHELEPDVWLNETDKDDDRRFSFCKPLLKNKSVLDFGCGAGGFLLKAKNVARQAEGLELEIRLKTHFEKVGLKVFSGLEEIGEKTYDIITCFHVLEHLPDPRKTLSDLSKRLEDGGQIIVEVPSANDVLLSLYQSREFSYFTYWSCHLFLFTADTISKLAMQSELRINYIKHIQRYPLSNHLYWLAKGKPGGHQKWYFLDSPELNFAYEKQLATLGISDTILASFSNSEKE